MENLNLSEMISLLSSFEGSKEDIGESIDGGLHAVRLISILIKHLTSKQMSELEVAQMVGAFNAMNRASEECVHKIVQDAIDAAT